MPIEILVAALRLAIIFLLALLFGLERQRSHKPVGFGTFIFIAIGSSALAITATALQTDNPLPLLSAIVTGIGFLGAGALIRQGDRTFGLTTAASVWVFAILGITIGVGEFAIGLMLYGLVWAVVVVDRYLQRQGIGYYHTRLTITTTRLVPLHDVERLLSRQTTSFRLITIQVDKKAHSLSLVYRIEGTKGDIGRLLALYGRKPWIGSVRLE